MTAADTEAVPQLAEKLTVLLPLLDERSRRLVLGAEAWALGPGGLRLVAHASGMARLTVERGLAELDCGGPGPGAGRIRRPGGGRKRAEVLDPELVPALLALMQPQERGDSQPPLLWTIKSLRDLAAELAVQGHRCSADTAARLLREQGFTLHANGKGNEGCQHPDRDAQFRYISDQAATFIDTGDPAISVDAQKAKLIGRWVKVVADHDTGAFAIATVRRWWDRDGRNRYPVGRRLLIAANASGPGSYRSRSWEIGLAAFAAEAGLEVTVCHAPPGTSRWSTIEHRLLSRVTVSWHDRPLTSHQVTVGLIGTAG